MVRLTSYHVRWEYETDVPGRWAEMDFETQDLLEDTFQWNPAGERTVHYGNYLSYDFNLKEMYQARYEGCRATRFQNIRRFQTIILQRSTH